MAPRPKRTAPVSSNGSSKKDLPAEEPATKKTAPVDASAKKNILNEEPAAKKTVTTDCKSQADSIHPSGDVATANTPEIDIKTYINASKRLRSIKADSFCGAVPERRTVYDAPYKLTHLFPKPSEELSALVDGLWATKSESKQIIRGDLTVSDLVQLRGPEWRKIGVGYCEGHLFPGAAISAYLSLIVASVKKSLKIALVPHKVVEMLDQRDADAANSLLGKLDLFAHDIVAIPLKYGAGYKEEREQWMLMWIVVNEKTMHHINSDCRRKGEGWPLIVATLTKTAKSILKANAVSRGRVFEDREWKDCLNTYESPDQLYEFNSGLSVLIDATLMANGLPLEYSHSPADLVPLRHLITFRLLKNSLY